MVCLACVAVWVTIGLIVYKFFFSGRKGKTEVQKNDWKKDTVYLHQFPRSKTLPNMSPFCLKVETFLKANKIPHEICPVLMARSEYGLLPFVELNGEHIADSQIIINRLTEHFEIKPLSSSKDEAIARAVDRMVDIHTFLVQYQFKVVENDNAFFSQILRDAGCPQALLPLLTPLMAFWFRRKAAQRIAAGVGKLSTESYKSLLRKDYDALQAILEQKEFLFGDHVSAADCTVFGHLATILYLSSGSYAKDVLKEDYPGLVEYCNRVRDTAFGKEFAGSEQ